MAWRFFTAGGVDRVAAPTIFTNEAARDTAIPAPTEGMRAYLTAPTVPAATGVTTAVPLGVQTIYNGFVWVCTTPVGAGSDTDGTSASTSYVSTLTSDTVEVSVTLVTGTTARIEYNSTARSSNDGAELGISVAVSLATTLAASNNNGALPQAPGANRDLISSRSFILTGLTAGTNKFLLSYRTSAGTITYKSRSFIVTGIA